MAIVGVKEEEVGISDPVGEVGSEVVEVVLIVFKFTVEVVDNITEVVVQEGGENVFFVFFRKIEFFNTRHGCRFLGYLFVSFLIEMVSSFIGREDVFCIG